MAKYLVVVESPAKAKTINRFLGSDYIVHASYGHVRDLPKNDLGVDVENAFEPKYVTLKESGKAVKALKDAAAKVERILLATDPDREGEAIGWHIAELLKPAKKPVQRIEFNEITKRCVLEAASQPREINYNLVNAQQARRVLDRLVGYKISPLLQWSIRKGLSAGRVQSVAVRMVCEREQEIRAFVAVEYWTLDAALRTPSGESFTARLSRINGENAQLGDEASVKQVLSAIDGAVFKAATVERKETRRNPYPPFITSTMQQEASRKLRFSPRKTMRIAQQLYEGIALGDEGSIGLITYMRTDSTRLADEAVQEARGYIGERFSPSMVPSRPNTFKSKKGAQDAHEAIRPTQVARTPEAMARFLDDDQLKLYTLIWKRFLACQMAPAVFDQTVVMIEAKACEFRATGSIMKFPGFTVLYEETADDKANGDGKDTRLPEINEGDHLGLDGFDPQQHFTKPPARYTEATLIRALEENGIGRPSTYDSIINVIMERGYVAQEKGRLMPTSDGEIVNEMLVRNFPDILEIAFTARLEEDLDHVEEGDCEWHELLKVFYGDFARSLDAARRNMVRDIAGDEVACPKCGGEMEIIEGRFGPFLQCKKTGECDGRMTIRKKAASEPTDEVCDKCGAPMVIRAGRFGRFMACSTYPKCKNTHNVDKEGRKVERQPRPEPTKTDQKCPTCGAFLLIRNSRLGEPFYGCEKYPKCRFTKPMELNLACPREGCDGELEVKRVRGRRFIGCNQYPKCDFTTIGQVDKKTSCPKCGLDWTTMISRKGKPSVRRCPRPGCGFEREEDQPGAESADASEDSTAVSESSGHAEV